MVKVRISNQKNVYFTEHVHAAKMTFKSVILQILKLSIEKTSTKINIRNIRILLWRVIQI